MSAQSMKAEERNTACHTSDEENQRPKRWSLPTPAATNLPLRAKAMLFTIPPTGAEQSGLICRFAESHCQNRSEPSPAPEANTSEVRNEARAESHEAVYGKTNEQAE